MERRRRGKPTSRPRDGRRARANDGERAQGASRRAPSAGRRGGRPAPLRSLAPRSGASSGTQPRRRRPCLAIKTRRASSCTRAARQEKLAASQQSAPSLVSSTFAGAARRRPLARAPTPARSRRRPRLRSCRRRPPRGSRTRRQQRVRRPHRRRRRRGRPWQSHKTFGRDGEMIKKCGRPRGVLRRRSRGRLLDGAAARRRAAGTAPLDEATLAEPRDLGVGARRATIDALETQRFFARRRRRPRPRSRSWRSS